MGCGVAWVVRRERGRVVSLHVFTLLLMGRFSHRYVVWGGRALSICVHLWGPTGMRGERGREV